MRNGRKKIKKLLIVARPVVPQTRLAPLRDAIAFGCRFNFVALGSKSKNNERSKTAGTNKTKMKTRQIIEKIILVTIGIA